MSELEEYTEVLHRFCRELSGKVADQADSGVDPHEVSLVLDATRQTIANLLLVEFECERVLADG
jgi:hypothetical protein